jgi:hypothetical protein
LLDTAARILQVRRVSGSLVLLANEIAGSVAVCGAGRPALGAGRDGSEPRGPHRLATALVRDGDPSLFTLVLSILDLAADRKQGSRGEL